MLVVLLFIYYCFCVAGIPLPSIYDQLFLQNQHSGRISVSNLNSILSNASLYPHQLEKVNNSNNKENLPSNNNRLCKSCYKMALHRQLM